ncbi:MAG TPA: hypothetical protein GX497_04030 [Bacillus bacterium]|nr:hypothetical protein [Bacillus sp. (in: firmicutes)]
MKIKNQFLGLFLVLIAFSYVCIYFFPIPLLETAVSIFIVIFIILALPALVGSLKIITYTLLVLAITMLVAVKAPIGEWIDGVRVNLTLVSIFTFVPLLGIPVRLGGYLESLKLLFERLNPKPTYVFLITQTLTHLLAVVLNIGSISIVHYLSKAAPIQSARLLVSAVNRGFISVIFWSPYFAAMAVVLSMLPITWGAILPYSLGIVLISFVVSILIDWSFITKANITFAHEVSAAKEEEIPAESGGKSDKQKLSELIFLLLFMMLTILGIEFFSSLTMVVIICLVAFLFPLLWSLLYKKQREYGAELKDHIYITLPRMKKEVVLFFVSGFFSAAFVATNISATIINSLNEFFGGFTIGIAYCIVLVIITTSIVGMHPIVPVTIFAASFNPSLLGFSPEYFAILLLVSWGISNSFSPATASNNLIANLWGVDITKVTWRWNMKYGMILAILLPIYLEIVNI